jgi:putative ABC transport system ATP-binding protein
MKAIEAHGVSKDYSDGSSKVTVLQKVSLSVDRGEVVLIEGPSGSGKTTLLLILGCLLSPSRGHVSIGGVKIDPRRASQLVKVRRESIGFIFQHYNLFEALTVHENVEFALNVRGIRGGRARSLASGALEAVGLGHKHKALPRDLSGGQKQRVSIARALSASTPIILADEPTASLDYKTGRDVLGGLRKQVKERGLALIVVSHDRTVREFSDRVVEIRDGRLVREEHLRGSARLVAAS